MKRLCVVVGLLLAYAYAFSQNDRDLDNLFIDYKIIQNNLSPQIEAQDGAVFKIDFRDISYKVGRIELEEVDIFQKGYKLNVISEDGLNTTRPNRIKAYKSTDPRYPIRITADEKFAYGYLDDNVSKIFFEPLSHFVSNAQPNELIVYDENAVKDKTLKCGANADYHVGEENNADSGNDYKSNGVCRVVEVAIASDYSMYQEYGSVEAVENHAIGVLNNVQGNYDEEFGDLLEFKLVEQHISTCSNCDPWTGDVGAGNLLSSFSAWASGGFTQNHDVGTLWTRRNLDGGSTVGIAWVSSVCTSYKYNVCQDFSDNAAYKRVLLAHELGHNFGASHDAVGQGTIMAPSVNNTNAWSSQSINVIQNFINGLSCLSSNCDGGPVDGGGGGSNTPTCNDGIQNGNETGTDCGGSQCDPCTGPGPTCNDGIINGDEQGVDCGGPDCDPCSGLPNSCGDGVQNGSETGVDCGGSCEPCGGILCTGTGEDSFFEYIKEVRMGSTTYASNNDNGYRDFTSKTFYLKTELQTAIALTPGYGEQVYEEYWTIWIDLNKDNIFSSNERLFQGRGEGRITGTVTIPYGTEKVNTTMRVAVKWGDYPSACGSYDYGEIEDYNVQIDPLGGSSCTDGRQNGGETDIDCGGSCPPCETNTVKLETGQIGSVGTSWKKVTLSQYYNSMVVIATPVYPDGNRDPVLTRITNAGGNSFHIRLQSPGGTVSPLSVHYLVVEEGVYTKQVHGIQMEAIRYNSMQTSTARNWKINPVAPSVHFDFPVVIGQVMTNNDERWSSFWGSHTYSATYATGRNSISVGKHLGESASQFRNNEIVGYIILESDSGTLNGHAYEAKLSTRSVESIKSSSTGYVSNLDVVTGKGKAFLGMSGMMGANGCWPVLATSSPVQGGRLRIALDEDIQSDAERFHIPERVAYFVISDQNNLQDDGITDNREKIENEKAFSIYPNPVSDILTIQSYSDQEVRYRIMSLTGTEMYVGKGTGDFQLSMAGSPNGLYLVEIEDEKGERSSQKFVKSSR